MIIECSECGKEISDKAKFCVNCGCPVDVSKSVVQNSAKAEYYYQKETDKPEARTLKIVAKIILVCGIILSVILIIVGIGETSFWGVWKGLNTVLIAVGVLFAAIVLWAVLRASGGASSDIRKIKDKLEDE